MVRFAHSGGTVTARGKHSVEKPSRQRRKPDGADQPADRARHGFLRADFRAQLRAADPCADEQGEDVRADGDGEDHRQSASPACGRGVMFASAIRHRPGSTIVRSGSRLTHHVGQLRRVAAHHREDHREAGDHQHRYDGQRPHEHHQRRASAIAARRTPARTDRVVAALFHGGHAPHTRTGRIRAKWRLAPNT